MTEDEDAHCLDLVRNADKDRFLAALFAPDAARPHLLALYAFNLEIARVRETVSEPQLGEIRHRWWIDTIEAIFRGEVPDHPVARGLAHSIAAGNLPKAPFVNLIESRQFDLYDDPMPTQGDLEGYLGETSSSLIQMAAIILAGREAEAAAPLAGLAGVAFGIAGLLRALPIHRARGQCYIPKDILARHDLSPADFISATDADERTGKALTDMRNLARLRLAEARAGLGVVPASAMPAFLHVSLTELYLDRLDRLGSKALSAPVEVAQLRRQWRLYLCAKRNKF